MPASKSPITTNTSFNLQPPARPKDACYQRDARTDLIRHIIATPNLRSIVMRTFGSGNAPQSPWLINALREGTHNGKIIINISQCLQGCVQMGRYDTGYQLQEAGVVSGYDGTVEAAVTKLMYLQGKYDDPETIREMMKKSIRGEITV